MTNICADANPPILKGEKNGFYGKTHSDEVKKKLGDVNRGKDIKSLKGKESIRKSLINRWKDPQKRENQIIALRNRKEEKRSLSAIESYKKSAAERNSKMTPEQRSQRSLKGCETKKIKYAGFKRQRYYDETGKMRFRYVLDID